MATSAKLALTDGSEVASTDSPKAPVGGGYFFNDGARSSTATSQFTEHSAATTARPILPQPPTTTTREPGAGHSWVSDAADVLMVSSDLDDPCGVGLGEVAAAMGAMQFDFGAVQDPGADMEPTLA